MKVKNTFYFFKKWDLTASNDRTRHDWLGGDVGKFVRDQTTEPLWFLRGLDSVGSSISSCPQRNRAGASESWKNWSKLGRSRSQGSSGSWKSLWEGHGAEEQRTRKTKRLVWPKCREEGGK